MLGNPASRACDVEGLAAVQFVAIARNQAELLLSMLVKELDSATFAIGVKKSGY
jgi:hypothetical protein